MQAAPRVRCELVVVDNGSMDETPALLAGWAARQEVKVVLANEPAKGLSRARNKGLYVSDGEVIIMTDDDCVMQADYIQQAARFHKHPYLIGGKVLLGDEMDLPISIRLGDEPAQYDGRRKPSGFVIGANLTFHRWVAEAIGGFDEDFGAGSKYPAGEDSDFLFRAWLKGFIVRYEPQLVVRHFHGRRDQAEATRLTAGYSRADGALFRKHLHTLMPLRYLAQYAKATRWRDLRLVVAGMIAA